MRRSSRRARWSTSDAPHASLNARPQPHRWEVSPALARASAEPCAPSVRCGSTMATAGGSTGPGRWWSVMTASRPRSRARTRASTAPTPLSTVISSLTPSAASRSTPAYREPVAVGHAIRDRVARGPAREPEETHEQRRARHAVDVVVAADRDRLAAADRARDACGGGAPCRGARRARRARRGAASGTTSRSSRSRIPRFHSSRPDERGDAIARARARASSGARGAITMRGGGSSMAGANRRGRGRASGRNGDSAVDSRG